MLCLMKQSFFILSTLALVSLAMRNLAYTSATDTPLNPAETVQTKQPYRDSSEDLAYLLSSNSVTTSFPAQKSRHRKLRPIYCYLGGLEPVYQEAESYRSCKQLRDDLDHSERWIGNILAAPVGRGSKWIGVRISFKTPNPFARPGLQSGDIVLSLNHITTNQVEDCPALLKELRSASSLHFLIERKGTLLPIHVELH